MDQIDAKLLQGTVRQSFVNLFDAGLCRSLTLFDAGRDHVRLPTFPQLASNELPPLLTLLFTGQVGMHILSPGWRLTERRDVQITKQRHGDGAWDGRSGHDEVVRVDSGALERGPLSNAKLVLFIDHDQTQSRKQDLLVEQSLSPDQQIDMTGLDGVQEPLALAAGERTGQQVDAHATLVEIFAQRAEVLLGQHFGGGHQHRLTPVRDGQQHGVFGNDRLATAHFALQQSIHRHAAPHVLAQFADRLLLITRQLEGKQPADPGIDLGRGGQCGRALRALQVPAAECQGQLQCE